MATFKLLIVEKFSAPFLNTMLEEPLLVLTRAKASTAVFVVAVFFEKFVEQHRVHRLMQNKRLAPCSSRATGSGVTFHLFGHQAELRDTVGI